MKFHLTESAQMDFDDIGEWGMRNWGYKDAAEYLTGLNQKFEEITQNNLGQKRDEIKKGLLSYIYKSHVILFRRNHENNVQILRILNQRMDIERHLQ